MEFDGAADAVEVLDGEAAGVGVVAGFFVFGVGFGGDAVALDFEGGPAD